jgi:hypothetical protein
MRGSSLQRGGKEENKAILRVDEAGSSQGSMGNERSAGMNYR